MLTTRISLMNELALLAEKIGADIGLVRTGIGSDLQVGTQFLYAGAGCGGSCFPKNVKAPVRAAEDNGISFLVLNVEGAANERQRLVLVDNVVARFGEDLTGLHFAIWDLAFKPYSDDTREAPSLVVISELIRLGATVCARDPEAMPKVRRALEHTAGVDFIDDQLSALRGKDALLIVTEWRQFRSHDLDHSRQALEQPVMVDDRDLHDPTLMKTMGFEYFAVGRLGRCS